MWKQNASQLQHDKETKEIKFCSRNFMHFQFKKAQIQVIWTADGTFFNNWASFLALKQIGQKKRVTNK